MNGSDSRTTVPREINSTKSSSFSSLFHRGNNSSLASYVGTPSILSSWAGQSSIEATLCQPLSIISSSVVMNPHKSMIGKLVHPGNRPSGRSSNKEAEEVDMSGMVNIKLSLLLLVSDSEMIVLSLLQMIRPERFECFVIRIQRNSDSTLYNLEYKPI